jgi:hypothetical protein
MSRGSSHRRFAVVVFGWTLLYSRFGTEWAPVADFPTESLCDRALASRIDVETQAAIGGALADQPSDNPLRRQAYERAVRHVQFRYRCEPVR